MPLVRWIESLPPLNGLDFLFYPLLAFGAGILVRDMIHRRFRHMDERYGAVTFPEFIRILRGRR